MSEMMLYYSHFGSDPWGLDRKSNRNFYQGLIAILVCLFFLWFLTRNWLPAPVVEEHKLPVITPVVIFSLELDKVEQVVMPAIKAERKPLNFTPKPHAKSTNEASSVVRKKPVVKQQASAKEVAQRSGIMALQNQLQTLTEADLSIDNSRPKGVAGSQKGFDEDAEVMNPELRHLGASSKAKPEALVGDSGARLSAHKTEEVGYPSDNEAIGLDRGATGQKTRSLEEVQMVFEKQKMAFHALFSRALRGFGGARSGSVVVSLTISPKGEVVDCKIVSSSFRNAELNEKLLLRVRMMKFESRDVPEFTYSSYPITFIPS